jgi:hypothetical protein
MPKQVILKEKKKSQMQSPSTQHDQSSVLVENAMNTEISTG